MLHEHTLISCYAWYISSKTSFVVMANFGTKTNKHKLRIHTQLGVNSSICQIISRENICQNSSCKLIFCTAQTFFFSSKHTVSTKIMRQSQLTTMAKIPYGLSVPYRENHTTFSQYVLQLSPCEQGPSRFCLILYLSSYLYQ